MLPCVRPWVSVEDRAALLWRSGAAAPGGMCRGASIVRVRRFGYVAVRSGKAALGLHGLICRRAPRYVREISAG